MTIDWCETVCSTKFTRQTATFPINSASRAASQTEPSYVSRSVFRFAMTPAVEVTSLARTCSIKILHKVVRSSVSWRFPSRNFTLLRKNARWLMPPHVAIHQRCADTNISTSALLHPCSDKCGHVAGFRPDVNLLYKLMRICCSIDFWFVPNLVARC